MPFPYYLSVTVHVLAAMLWLGGMFFLALIGAPVLRGVEPPELRSRLFDALGRKFRSVGWLTLGVLLLTGVINLYYRGAFRADAWRTAEFWGSAWGRALAWKLVAVTVMLVVEGYHDWVLGPRAGQLVPGSPESLAMRRQASIYARVSAVCGVVIVIAAVRLARGG